MPPTPPVTSSFEFAALAESGHYRTALVKEFSSYLRGHVLEIGAGIGQISELLSQHPPVQSLLAVEPKESFCRQLSGVIPQHRTLCGTSAALAADAAVDAIVSINVLEHIEADAAELGRYRRLLASRAGHLCLFVPARPEIYAPLDADLGHFRRYTRAGLRAQLEQAGFQIRRLDYFNCVGYLAWWLSFRVLGQRHFKQSSVRLFDRWIFPAVFWLETHITSPPLGQSLLAVAQAAL